MRCCQQPALWRDGRVLGQLRREAAVVAYDVAAAAVAAAAVCPRGGSEVDAAVARGIVVLHKELRHKKYGKIYTVIIFDNLTNI